MPTTRFCLRHSLVLAWLFVMLVASPAAIASTESRLWAYCFFEASGGVGTKMAMIVTEPFPILASKKDMLFEGLVAREYDETQGIGNLLPGYKYFMSISGTDCRIRNSREEAQAGVDKWRASTEYGIVRFVAWKPSAQHTGLAPDGGADAGAGEAKPRVPPSPAPQPSAVDLQQLSRQARDRVAKVASSPEMIARSKDLARRRAEARQGRTPAKPAVAKPAVAAKPNVNAGGVLYWSCHYWNHGAKTSYYSAVGSAPQDKSITIVQEGLNYRKSWVAHLQQRGLIPGAGGTCTGMHKQQDVIGSIASSKTFYTNNYSARTVDTGWVPTVSK